jgi:hypothetical protein
MRAERRADEAVSLGEREELLQLVRRWRRLELEVELDVDLDEGVPLLRRRLRHQRPGARRHDEVHLGAVGVEAEALHGAAREPREH